MQFEKYDKILEQVQSETNLSIPAIANIIDECIMQDNNKFYEVLAYCIMSNHVHLLINFDENITDKRLGEIMKLIKGRSSRLINLYLNKSGKFWQKASYDHMIRNEKELENICLYILNNPVKAGLVGYWDEWKYTYCSGDFSR